MGGRGQGSCHEFSDHEHDLTMEATSSQIVFKISSGETCTIKYSHVRAVTVTRKFCLRLYVSMVTASNKDGVLEPVTPGDSDDDTKVTASICMLGLSAEKVEECVKLISAYSEESVR